MTSKPWIFGIIIGLVVGVFLGYILTPRPPHPTSNNLTLDVDQFDHRVNVAPRQGEVVQWINQSDSTPVQVTFLTDSPCVENGSTSTCTVNVSQGNFEYTCPGCQDPGFDPRSSSSGPGGFLHRLDNLFGIDKSHDVLAATAPPDPGGQRSARGTPPETVNAGIKCGASGAPTVIWNADHPNDPLPVKVGEVIHWKGGSLSSFQITNFVVDGTPVSVCQETNINTSHPLCTVQNPQAKPVTYTVTTSGTTACKTPSGTASVTVGP